MDFNSIFDTIWTPTDADFSGSPGFAPLTGNPSRNSHPDPVFKSMFLSAANDGHFQTNKSCTLCIFLDSNAAVVNEDDIQVHITGPTGYQVPAQRIKRSSDLITFTFWPVLPGSYIVNGFFKDNQHIQGSPSQLRIARNYGPISAIPIACAGHLQQLSMRHFGICCNTSNDQLFVADQRMHQILVYQPDGTFHFKFGTRGQDPGNFLRPTALAYDPVGDRILVTDRDNHRIQIFNSRGEYQSTFGSFGKLPGQFKFPWGIAVSRDGTWIAVADSKNSRIQLFDAHGSFVRQFANLCQENAFSNPRGITFSPYGDFLYVADFNHDTVFQLDINLTSCLTLIEPGTLNNPSGICVDDAGNLIVCDSKNHAVKIFRSDGQLIGTCSLEFPLDVTLTKTGFIANMDRDGCVNII